MSNLVKIPFEKLHNGLFHCPFEACFGLMPELAEIFNSFPSTAQYPRYRYVVDVKVHMLMPGMWPCIPNWHKDLIPRDVNLTEQPEKINHDVMYAWISGEPLTEFEYGKIAPRKWIAFTQNDKHRGTQATEHGWRVFIRAVPDTIMKSAPSKQWLRRQIQVYVEPDFIW